MAKSKSQMHLERAVELRRLGEAHLNAGLHDSAERLFALSEEELLMAKACDDSKEEKENS